jgi:hypothetical protein
MTRTKPLVVGSALGLTAGLGYTLCAIAFALFPTLAVDFTSTLFHGLSFAKMQSESQGFSFASFLLVLIATMAWGFIAGAVFSSIYNLLSREGIESESQYSSARVSTGRA